MKMTPLLLLITLTSLTSCIGQNATTVNNKNENRSISDIAKPNTVKELPKSIMLVYQDKKSTYWFGSWEDGLYSYDGKTLLHYTTKNGLPNNRIDEIKEDNFGNIYLTTSDGISKFDGQNFTTLEVSDWDNEWRLEPNDLWFKDGWNSKSIYRYDGKHLHKLQLPNTKIGEEYIRKNPTHPYPHSVYTIYKDSRGNMWFGTSAMGVFRYDGKTFDWITESDVTELHNGPANGVRSIIEDKDGYFWFNSLYRYKVDDRQNPDSTFYHREKSIGSLDGKRDDNLVEYLSIAKADNNDLWIATYDHGVYRYDGVDITHFTVKNSSEEIKLFTIYKDNEGTMWLGTPESGAYKFNGQTFEKFQPN